MEEEEGRGEARKKEDAGPSLTLKAVRPNSPSVGPDGTPKLLLTGPEGGTGILTLDKTPGG